MVTGGNRLSGEVAVGGAKNSVLKLMAATLLAEGTSTITNCPDILDVPLMAEVLRGLGATVELDGDIARITSPDEPKYDADFAAVRQFRASVCVLGPLVGRCKRARVALPGGDAIGSRPLWLAEVGYSTYRSGGVVSPQVRARFAYEHTPAFAAVALARTLALALASPHVGLIAWYELKDANPAAPVNGDVNNRHLGVAFADHRPKPALRALAFLQRLFEPGYRVLPQVAVRSSPADVPRVVVALQRGGGRVATRRHPARRTVRRTAGPAPRGAGPLAFAKEIPGFSGKMAQKPLTRSATVL